MKWAVERAQASWKWDGMFFLFFEHHFIHNTLVYKIFLKNALYLVIDWFPIILGRWFPIRSLFLAMWSEFCSVASFVFFGLENQIFEIEIFFEN